MHIKNLKQYYFIDKFDYSHLENLSKNISFIWRNKDKENSLKNLIKLRNFCKKHQRKLYISNDIKLANKINADGLYISSSNKNLIIASSSFRKDFKILGSAHNLKEIKMKELQGVNEVFLSPIFKEKYNEKLEMFRYLNLRNLTKMKDIALGGISQKNIKRFNLIRPFGFASISFFEKKRPLKKGPSL
tara:strand:- start:124 stop:687 length:564 start_codon:yes stop_codon:yes gene_type:complete